MSELRVILGWADPVVGRNMADDVVNEVEFVKEGGTHPTYERVLDALKLILEEEGREIRLLDAGCGIGLYREIIRQADLDVEYEGLDCNEVMLEEARKLFPETVFHKGSILGLPFSSRSYDVVLAGGILEHIRPWRRALGEMCRVARSHLVLHRITISKNPKISIIRERRFKGVVWQLFVPWHVLIREFSRRGFEPVKFWYLCETRGSAYQRTILFRRKPNKAEVKT